MPADASGSQNLFDESRHRAVCCAQRPGGQEKHIMSFRSLTLSAAIASLLGLASLAGAQTTYNEIRSGGFGTSTLPADAQEWFFDSFGAGSYKWDSRGRVLSNAAITQTFGTPGSLTSITMGLWSSSDADFFKFKIVDPTTFSATVTATGTVLALFSEDGTALRASRGGGAANAITGAGLGLTPGFYYIGEATTTGLFGDATFGVPRNNASQPLFDFTTDGVKDATVQGDMKLATNPFTAWTISGGPNLLASGNFTVGGANIALTGSDFAAVPEPGSLAAIGLVGLALARRRR
jgi:hypothetical protein